jgi:hypothetical protein
MRNKEGHASNEALRKQILKLLRGGEAHATFDSAIADFPPELRGEAPQGAPHTAWELLEHMRIAQADILEFSRNPSHVSPEWPSGYWPESRSPADAGEWERSIQAFRSDQRSLEKLISNEKSDLFSPIDHPDASPDHTLLREALLTADHNAYHIGELVFLRRLLGAWPAAGGRS